MAFHVTQCPGCESTFNTSARILQTAAGQVRCGACLTVFTAEEHFLSTNDVDLEEDADTSVFVGNNPTDYFDPSLFLTRQSLTAPESPRGAIATGNAFGIEAEDDTLTAPEDEAYFDLGEEDAETGEENRAQTITAPGTDEAEFQSAVEEGTDTEATTELDIDLAMAATPPVDFDTTLIELDEPADDTSSYSAFEFVPEGASFAATASTDSEDELEIPESSDALAAESTVDALEEEDDSTEAIRARARRALLLDDDALEALPAETRSAIDRILPPVELLAGTDSRWGRRILMTLGCLLLGGLLALQYLWQQLPTYSLLPGLRPFYEFACGYVPCTLPPFTDIAAIRSEALQVRSHPRRDDALAVSVSFRNTAAFPQAFPILILSFNSASNAVIALREFAPEEYLDEGLRNITQMPVMAPVQVELEIMDPGADAVNYTVAFRRP